MTRVAAGSTEAAGATTMVIATHVLQSARSTHSSRSGSLQRRARRGKSQGRRMAEGWRQSPHEGGKIACETRNASREMVPGTCQIRARYVPDTCQIRAGYVPGTCRVRAGYVPGTCRVRARYVPGTCRVLHPAPQPPLLNSRRLRSHQPTRRTHRLRGAVGQPRQAPPTPNAGSRSGR